MDRPLKVEIKLESADVEEHDIMDSVGCFNPAGKDTLHAGENLNLVYTNLESAVFTDNCLDASDSKLVTNKVSLNSNRIVKESNEENVSKIKRKSKTSMEDKLQQRESYLKMKESILAVKEASIRCKENILKLKESNLRIREAKLLKKESNTQSKKAKSQRNVSKENKESTEPAKATKAMQTCTICNKTLKNKAWIIHMREAHSPTTYVCYCKRFFHGRRLYDRHVQFVHNGGNRYPKSFQLTEENVKCTKCDLTFDHPYRLKTHMRNVHSGEGKEIHCKVCDSKLKSQSYLNTHMRRVHFDDGKQYTCKICGKHFDSPRYVLVHIKNSHEKHGLRIRSPKKQVKCEERQDWSIENQKVFKYTKKPKQNYCESWQIVTDDIDSNRTNTELCEAKLELDEDIQGFSLKDVKLAPEQKYLIEREIKHEEM